MAMSATLTVPSNIIAGQRTTAMLLVANSGASDVTVSAVQAVLTPSGGPAGAQPVVTVAPPQYPPNRTSTVTASGTLYVPVDMVFNFPQTPGSGNAMAGSSYLLDFVVTVSDGTVCTVTTPQWVSVAPGSPGPSQGYGQLAFNDGRNLINVAML
jgi:hypothetical protein